MKGIMWSIRKPHTDNIISEKKRDEIRKRIPKDLSALVPNYIYETKSGGGCGKVIGEFRVLGKTYIYAYEHNGNKHLANTAFIMPALSDEDLFNYLYDGRKNDGWALRISDLKIYDKPKELSEFNHACPDNVYSCAMCRHGDYTGMKCTPITRPPQSWCYVEVKE